MSLLQPFFFFREVVEWGLFPEKEKKNVHVSSVLSSVELLADVLSSQRWSNGASTSILKRDACLSIVFFFFRSTSLVAEFQSICKSPSRIYMHSTC